MNLRELNPPLIELPAGQTFFRVQLLRARRDSAKVGALVLAPPGALSGRFCLTDQPTAYLADSAATALFESQFRRDTVSRSLADLGKRALLQFATTQPLRLVDLRSLAEPYPVLQSLRIAQTQALAKASAKFAPLRVRGELGSPPHTRSCVEPWRSRMSRG